MYIPLLKTTGKKEQTKGKEEPMMIDEVEDEIESKIEEKSFAKRSVDDRITFKNYLNFSKSIKHIYPHQVS